VTITATATIAITTAAAAAIRPIDLDLGIYSDLADRDVGNVLLPRGARGCPGRDSDRDASSGFDFVSIENRSSQIGPSLCEDPAETVTARNEWQGLDEAANAAALLAFLDRLAEVPEMAAAKRRSFELLGARPGLRLLDAGCGTGTDALALADAVAPGGEVVGVDSAEVAVAEATRRATGRAGIRFQTADVTALPFADATFDGARSDRTIQHVGSPEEAIRELLRVTRPGGRVVLSDATFTLQGGRRPPATPSTGGADLRQFVPVLLHMAGAVEITVEGTDFAADPGPEVLATLGLAPDSRGIEVRVVHVCGTRPLQ
jgi:SAM-dependent methyltransferase